MQKVLNEWQKFIKENKVRGRYKVRSIQTGEERRYDGTRLYNEANETLKKQNHIFFLRK